MATSSASRPTSPPRSSYLDSSRTRHRSAARTSKAAGLAERGRAGREPRIAGPVGAEPGAVRAARRGSAELVPVTEGFTTPPGLRMHRTPARVVQLIRGIVQLGVLAGQRVV